MVLYIKWELNGKVLRREFQYIGLLRQKKYGARIKEKIAEICKRKQNTKPSAKLKTTELEMQLRTARHITLPQIIIETS